MTIVYRLNNEMKIRSLTRAAVQAGVITAAISFTTMPVYSADQAVSSENSEELIIEDDTPNEINLSDDADKLDEGDELVIEGDADEGDELVIEDDADEELILEDDRKESVETDELEINEDENEDTLVIEQPPSIKDDTLTSTQNSEQNTQTNIIKIDEIWAEVPPYPTPIQMPADRFIHI